MLTNNTVGYRIFPALLNDRDRFPRSKETDPAQVQKRASSDVLMRRMLSWFFLWHSGR